MQYRLFICFWALVVAVCTAPTPASGQLPLMRERKLPKNMTDKLTCLYQDSEGWIWIGTAKGILQYDGSTTTYIQSGDSLLQSAVSAIVEYNRTLYVGFTNGAIAVMSYKGVRSAPELVGWNIEEGLPKQRITGFVVDHHQRLWIATYGEGIYCWDKKRLTNFNNADDGIVGDEVYCIAAGQGGDDVWIGTDAGISTCTLTPSGNKKVRNLKVAEGLPDEIIQVIQADGDKGFWLGAHEKGVWHFDPATNRFEKIDLPNHAEPITNICTVGNTELWIGTEKNGLCVYNLLQKRCDHPKELANAEIQALLKDREGLIWTIANQRQLLSCARKFSKLTLDFGEIQALRYLQNGGLLLGAPRGLFLHKAGITQPVSAGGYNVLSLLEDSRGLIWAGTFGNGLLLFDGNLKLIKRFTEKDGLPNGSIFSIAETESRIWLATLGGLTQIKEFDDEYTIERVEDPIISNVYLYKIAPGPGGKVWLGTDGKGLVKYEGGRFEFVQQPSWPSINSVYSICVDLKGTVWFTSDGSGLFAYDGRAIRQFTEQQFLHSKEIQDLEIDPDGNLILAYSDGLDIMNPATGHVQFWSLESGLPEVQSVLNAGTVDHAGNIWIGTENGVLKINRDTEPIEIDPKTVLTAVQVFSKPVDFNTNHSFGHNENYVIFEYNGLWFAQPEAVNYQYKLEGFDHDWKTTRDRSAAYPNLPPGKFTFRVKSSEHGMFENTSEAVYNFEIRQPFWKTWWFLSLFSMVMAGLAYWVISNREARVKREADLKRERIESQFATLKSQINPHFLFNSFNTLITIIEENPKIAVEYVEHLADFYRSIMLFREKDFITIQEELELVEDFCFLLKKRFEDNFTLQINVPETDGRIMPLTLQLLVENAVKHNIISRNKPLLVEIFVENAEYLVVKNNHQKKTQAEAGTHFGLQSLIKRYELLGTLPLVVQETADSFVVKVPIVKR